MNKEQLLRYYKNEPEISNRVNLYWDTLDNSFKENNINEPYAIMIALATIRIECSRSFLPMVENLYYSAPRLLAIFPKYFNLNLAKQYEMKPEMIANRVYANRMGNGSEQSGDGWKHRGAGWLMWTGKENQLLYGINPESYQDIKANSDALVKYFIDRQIIPYVTILKTQSVGSLAWQQTLKQIRIKINGGLNGYSEFEKVVKSYLS